MKWEMNRAGLGVFIALIFAGLWDLGCLVFGNGVDNSISAWTVGHLTGDRCHQFPPLVLLTIGAVAGHLLFPMRGKA